MAVKIKGKANGEIDCKRLYLSGIVATSKCPSCGATASMDFSSNYLSYPVAGQPEQITFVCRECDDKGLHSEWPEMVVMNIELVSGGG